MQYPAGRDLQFQVYYFPELRACNERSTVNLLFLTSHRRLYISFSLLPSSMSTKASSATAPSTYSSLKNSLAIIDVSNGFNFLS